MQSRRNASGVFCCYVYPILLKKCQITSVYYHIPRGFYQVNVRLIHMARRKLRYIHAWMHIDLSLDRGNIQQSKYYFPRCEDTNSNNITLYSVLHSSNRHICRYNVHSVHIIAHKSGQLSHTYCPLSIWVDRISLLCQPQTLHIYIYINKK